MRHYIIDIPSFPTNYAIMSIDYKYKQKRQYHNDNGRFWVLFYSKNHKKNHVSCKIGIPSMSE